jgi:DNA-binding NarL/FixJ family response regulator
MCEAVEPGRDLTPGGTTRPVVALSHQQRDVLAASAHGLTTDEVAALLELAPEEVRATIAEAIIALGACSKLEAVIIALRTGQIALPIVP